MSFSVGGDFSRTLVQRTRRPRDRSKNLSRSPDDHRMGNRQRKLACLVLISFVASIALTSLA